MKNKVAERFSEFLERWICQLDDYFQQLMETVSNERSKTATSQCLNHQQEVEALVLKVTQHYKEYYTMKWALAHEDVFAFFSPVWLSPLETACSWITGWKPSAAFKLVDSVRKNNHTLAELTHDQESKIEELRRKIKWEEDKVEREMERQQVAIANGKMVELTRMVYKVSGIQASQVEGLARVALKGLMAGLEKVMKSADCVRLRALKGILDVLSPLQCVEFLAATCMLHIKLRQQGKKKNSIINN
ncbi:protein DOG1-like 4 [Mercurialis annua]|uniref:protein DOG1-like 4 n=1 Tax=Mercurialis annua TaxID=3986 RepID=UPI00215FBAB8|nr:protein DOG1-like 4 [Mercurialis annua]